uniref:Uncharacterized protein n=1 Tax=Arundo donax TaxID=35708 RepID=A0A0A9FHJ8_ARUDO
MIKWFEHLGSHGSVKVHNRKQMKALTPTIPVMKGQFLDFHLPSKKDTMENCSGTAEIILFGSVLLAYRLQFLQTGLLLTM